MNSKFDEIVFGKTSFGDILKEIHKKSNSNEKLIIDLIQDLKNMIKTPGDAMMMVDLIKGYMTLNIQNNEQLVKMAAIIQKAVDKTATGESDSFVFTPEDRIALENVAKNLNMVPEPKTAVKELKNS